MPQVSVIVPVYNVEPYVARCVRSLFGQTLQDLEFIFVDDCTPDRSMEIIRQIVEEEFPARKCQVKVFRMPQNSGQAKVRMQGISMTTGEYVIHCDSDDSVEADAYERMYRLAKDKDADIVTCGMRRGNDDGWEVYLQGSAEGEEVHDILTGKVMGSLWNRMVKRELLTDLFPPEGNMAEDMVLTIQMTCRAKKIVHLNLPLYKYYVTPQSISVRPGMEAALARHSSMYANAKVCVALLQGSYDYSGHEPEMVAFKYRCRHYLEPYVHIPEIYEKWRRTFPEVDRRILFTPGIPQMTKFWYVLIRLHLYHPWKVLTGKHKLNNE